MHLLAATRAALLSQVAAWCDVARAPKIKKKHKHQQHLQTSTASAEAAVAAAVAAAVEIDFDVVFGDATRHDATRRIPKRTKAAHLSIN